MTYLKNPSIGAMFNRTSLGRLAGRIRDAVVRTMPEDPARAKWLQMRCTPRELRHGRVLRYLKGGDEKTRNRQQRRHSSWDLLLSWRRGMSKLFGPQQRLRRATGPGSYAEGSPNQLLSLARKARAVV